MRSPFAADGLLETRDALDRRVSYVVVWDEQAETLGLIAWKDRRMICFCREGRQAFEDRLDGSMRWEDPACPHEAVFLAVKRQRSSEAVGISGERTYGISSGMWE